MKGSEQRERLVGRLLSALGVLATTVAAGTIGYHQLGAGRWGLFDCFYMTMVTVSTVGFAETLPGLAETTGARAFTVGLLVLGSGTLLYFVSVFTAFIIEGDLLGALRRTRMQNKIDRLSGHIVVCGVGSTGMHVVEELVLTGQPFVVIDNDAERLQRISDDLPNAEILSVLGDATDDATLHKSGIERARGVIAALHDDKQNVFLTITARALSPKARIVAKATELHATEKLSRAGADRVVAPNRIGGMRMVSEMVRPRVVEFLDVMLHDREQNLRLEEIAIPEGSSLLGATLRDTDIRKATDVLVIATQTPDGHYQYNPSPTTELVTGLTLIVMGATKDIRKLREGIASGAIGRS